MMMMMMMVKTVVLSLPSARPKHVTPHAAKDQK